MAAPENEHIYGIQLRESADDGSDFGNADADYRKLFLGEDGDLHLKDSSGTVTDIESATAHIADTTDAHDASAVSFDATGLDNTSATEVQTALEELDAAITAADGGGATVATVDAVLGSDVTMVNADTFYDGPSGSFAAGTWLIVWKVGVEPIVSTGQQYWWTAKLWDGTTIYDESGFTDATTGNKQGQDYHLAGTAIVTLGSTTTLKVSVACGRGSSASKIQKNVHLISGTGNKVSRISGYKVT